MNTDAELESQIDQWRGYVRCHRVISSVDIDEMEGHLRDQVSDLSAVGLTAAEAFLVAVKRMGNLDAISREFAVEHSDRLWKQLMLMPATSEPETAPPKRELSVVLALAVSAGLAVKAGLEWLPELALARNISLFVLPFLTGYFAWKRKMTVRGAAALVAPFAVAALLLNLFPFVDNGSTEVIAAIHAPIALWFVVGLAYVGGDWRSHRRRMDFVRFTGEWVVYMTLLALGGGVLIGLTVGAFASLDLDVEWVVEQWILPFGAAGALLVAAWLVEAKQNVIENIAPVLTRVFTPLTTLMLLALLAAFAAARSVVGVDRDLLILMDLILVIVLGLLLYAISARDPLAPPDLFDKLQLVLVVSALAVDVLMLTAMASRIAEFGFTPNKVTALGLNLVLLVNLVWSVRLGLSFVRGRCGFGAVERWQTSYLPVYGGWAALAVIALPPAFNFV
ncbi:permease prefix domain 1-containing protein [Rhodococcus tibetensis]|uniref:Permease prefix domain 1-containing protein n=1 Tax=Rhodococcus tibetensis TaxID=2965064 RepID=A0ABT1Q9Y6_9NOCA|nr:permease prefix domain 1-containing protein [Rhodococcus sp. FXJ9.536]MCQ4119076.1 permease prefix domain 1-containing protein [Rhodococcus sp. FXJ9.536]